MKYRVLSAILLVIYLAVVVLVGLWPQRIDSGVHRQVFDVVGWLQSHGFVYMNYGVFDALVNVVWFVPVGLLAAMIVGRRLWYVALIGSVALSTGIEVAQGALLPARVGTISDVIANSIGATVGMLLGVVIDQAVQLRRSKRDARRRTSVDTADVPAELSLP